MEDPAVRLVQLGFGLCEAKSGRTSVRILQPATAKGLHVNLNQALYQSTAAAKP